MTDTQTPADPSAYRVDLTRDATGRITLISVIDTEAHDDGEGESILDAIDEDDVGDLLSMARAEERGSPPADYLPSDGAIIRAALRLLGIPILGEDDDDDDGAESEARIQHAMAFGLEPPEEAPHLDPQDYEDRAEEKAKHEWVQDEGDDWRDVPVLVQVPGRVDRLVMAGAFCDDNRDEPGLEATLRDLVRGDVDWARFGGGAAPLVMVVRAIENPDFDADVLNVFKHTIAKADALDALLAAAREAEAFMSGFEGDEAQDPPVDDRLAALRAAIAQAEGRG